MKASVNRTLYSKIASSVAALAAISLLTGVPESASASGVSAPPRLAVVNKADATVSVFNLESGKLEFTERVGYYPHEVVASRDGQMLYVSNYGKDHVRSTAVDARPGNTLSVIDLEQTARTSELDLGIPCAPHGLAVAVHSRTLYATCEDRQEVAVIDLVQGKIIYSISTNQAQSHQIVVSEDESRAYTANFSAGTVTVLDLKSKTVLKQIATGPGTEGVGLSKDDKTLFVTSVLGSTLSKIDTATLTVTATVSTEKSPIRVMATPDGKYLIVNSSATGQVLVHDPQTLKLIKKIKVGTQPIGLSVPNNDNAYVANMKDGSISIIDLNRLEVSSTLRTGARPDGLVYISPQ